jgi:hypothetical protein
MCKKIWKKLCGNSCTNSIDGENSTSTICGNKGQIFFKKQNSVFKLTLMKSIFKIIVCLFLFSNSLVAQNDSAVNANTKSIVYVYRLPRYTGATVRTKVYSNNLPIIMLRNGSCYKYEAIPGEYVFSFYNEPNSGLKLNLEQGKTYFIECSFEKGFWSAIPEMSRFDSITAESRIQQHKLTQLHYEPISLIKPKSRIGLFMGGGGGFYSIPLFIDDKGNEVTLSAGGGFAFGAEYGYEVSKFFDVSANCYYQSSSLSEILKNASASFNRMGFTVTPALVIPIKTGEHVRFRLGAGLGLYSYGTMNIDASKISGIKYKYKYGTALGYHGSLIFESNVSDRSSFSLELKYYDIQYEYTSNGSSHSSPDPQINLPDGSGIDFLMGYSYHF